MFRLSCAALIAAVLCGCTFEELPPKGKEKEEGSRQKEQRAPQRVATKHLPNVIRVHEKVLSGGSPEGDQGFAELRALGVKTIVSVDGALPDVETARKFGLRYVHLPHGYDGIPDARALELAKVVRDLPGIVYIHCHHGKHRSPAATAVACVGAGLIGDDEALALLETAGTSPNYRGLYQSAQATRAIDPAVLARQVGEFPERVKPTAMAEAMVAIERTYDHLKQLAANKWQRLEKKPDLDAPHEALMLREHYTELLRTDEALAQPARFIELLKESEAAAQELEDALQSGQSHAAAQRLERITANCAACHQRFRDVPLGEK
jgi:hypothetical protein